jgi:hypothetical protein
MSNPSPEKASANAPQPEAPAKPSAIALPTEEHLRTFWEQNRNVVLVGVVAVLIAIVARGGYEQVVARREAGIREAFAAANTPDKLRAFARDHGRHPLAGTALLQLGDQAYANGQLNEAQGYYVDAASVLSGTPFAARATLGQGVCLLTSGKTAEGTAILQRLADDSTQLQSVRCEAAYHLASQAFASGNFEAVVKETDLVLQADPNSIWAQRAMLLRSRTPVSAVAAPAEKKGETPAVSIKLPGS